MFKSYLLRKIEIMQSIFIISGYVEIDAGNLL